MGQSADLADRLVELVQDRNSRMRYSRAAYELGRDMVWDRVAKQYVEVFEIATDVVTRKRASARKRASIVREQLPPLLFNHLLTLTDTTGIIQHAVFRVPNRNEGYSTDDNARGLILATRIAMEEPALGLHLATTYLGFLLHAFNPDTKRMRNFLGYDRRWLEDAGSEECHGRTLWALGYVTRHSTDPGLCGAASDLYFKAMPISMDFTSIRAIAFSVLGLIESHKAHPDSSELMSAADVLSEKLIHNYVRCSSPDWQWFEDQVTYFNARVPEALLRFGESRSRADMVQAGLRSLEWLVSIQTSEQGYFSPIGNKGFYKRGATRARFDQQPIEPHAVVSACLEAFRVTGGRRWREHAVRAFRWFLGFNDLGLPVYDDRSGGCRDGLHEDGLNQNEGAESTLAFMQSLLDIRPYYSESALGAGSTTTGPRRIASPGNGVSLMRPQGVCRDEL